MKQSWHTLAAKIDALSLRERVMLFGAVAALLIFLLFFLLLDPLFSKQKTFSDAIAQQHSQIAAIDQEVTLKIQAHSSDPDQADRVRLEKITHQTAQMIATLHGMQNGLVGPERIVFLLENILKQHARLRLVSLKTLPSSAIGDGVKPGAGMADSKAAAPAPAEAVKPGQVLRRHGVEVVLQGSYLDMVNYMDALEAMPAQVFWGRARLEADEYPNASLTLTLYTLSLDQKWIAL